MLIVKRRIVKNKVLTDQYKEKYDRRIQFFQELDEANGRSDPKSVPTLWIITIEIEEIKHQPIVAE